MKEHGETFGELAEQRSSMQTHRVRDDLYDALVADLVAVTEGAVDDRATPLVGQALDVGQLVGEACSNHDPASVEDVSGSELDDKTLAVPRHLNHPTRQDLAAVAADLCTSGGRELCRRVPVPAEEAVHVRGRGVAWLTGVDHDHRPALTAELKGRREAGRRSADDGDVTVPDDGGGIWVAHAGDGRGLSQNVPNFLQNTQEGESMTEPVDVEHIVRRRLRSLRTTLGLSLEDLAARTNLSPSTISRVETGKRSISLDILLPLAAGLQVGLDALLDVSTDDDVVIRPSPSRAAGRTTWVLSRPGGSRVAVKMRLEPTRTRVEQRVHPGHDWLFVLSGRIRLLLGEREVTVETGEAAEFATMTPHAFAAIDHPAELLMIFDRDGATAHVHRGKG